MSVLLSVGLIGFISVHLTRVVADHWRERLLSQGYASRYKLAYSLISLLSLICICIGYGEARLLSPVVWMAEPWMFNLAAGLMLLSSICLVAAYLQRSVVKVRLRHPMLWGIVLYCIAHLLSNGRVVDIWLFASLLVWALVVLGSCYRRDALMSIEPVTPTKTASIVNLLVAVLAYALVVAWLHFLLIGVRALPYL